MINSKINAKRNQKGFTLIEMIGVLAVIGVLAAMVAPKIFDAIRDARIDSLVSDINTVRSSVVSFYKDTNSFPTHDALGLNGNELMASSIAITGGTAGFGAALAPIPGFRGPYLDKELLNTVNPTANIIIYDSMRSAAAANVPVSVADFDLDGDGVADYTQAGDIISFAVVDSLTYEEAQEISGILDNDRTDPNWFNRGRVRVGAVVPPAGGAAANYALGTAGLLPGSGSPNGFTLYIYLASR